MERRLKEFNDRGYMRIASALPPATINSVLDAAKTVSFEAIFKDVIGEFTTDAYRSQGSFTKAAPLSELRKSATKMISMFGMGWAPKNWVVLYSKAGGQEQAPHQDFPKREVTHARAGVGFKGIKAVRIKPTIQAGIIIALMPNTKLIVYDGCFNDADVCKKRNLVLEAGECIIFRGDLVHAGAAFSEDNYRVHATLTIPAVPWDENATEAVPTRKRKCAFCEMRKDTSQAINSHAQYCQGNPRRDTNLKRKRELNWKTTICKQCSRVCATRSIFHKHKCGVKN
jgi:hypothetical protein